MSAAYQELFLEQGTDFTTTITLNDIYSDPYDLTGVTAKSQIRKSYYSANATATFSTSINTGSGTITLNLSSHVTANISPGRYVYDLLITSPVSVKTRVVEGIATILPSVTR